MMKGCGTVTCERERNVRSSRTDTTMATIQREGRDHHGHHRECVVGMYDGHGGFGPKCIVAMVVSDCRQNHPEEPSYSVRAVQDCRENGRVLPPPTPSELFTPLPKRRFPPEN